MAVKSFQHVRNVSLRIHNRQCAVEEFVNDNHRFISQLAHGAAFPAAILVVHEKSEAQQNDD